ncbi:uncharacterized protein THITE_2110662 [Thermothielavioides terrestris NRRL 8126]|uniref:Uncharacterized protein n=1 Tax=Thermothielavioides terrestris (strain ATCC 38088 / NRRL 8126) TaxID=578455 RepID=G2QU27_THETT|nr:uncharacterized protein THITE_2110662 [Thermothielavioides terrestris NRRL 8126]AEO64488.1 hypothetical protein THITE_2110662 [Thermothielavioides terrestris NRRL 8126]
MRCPEGLWNRGKTLNNLHTDRGGRSNPCYYPARLHISGSSAWSTDKFPDKNSLWARFL